MRISTILKAAAVLVVAVIVTAVAILYSTDFSAYKGDVAALVHKATGRDLVIDGDFAPSLGLTPAIEVAGVRFANASWGTRKDMARIGRFRAEIELLPLLFGDVRVKQIVLSGADILLESRSDGTGNWVFRSPGGKPGGASTSASAPVGPATIPTVDSLLIEDSVLVWRDGRTGASTTIRIDRLQGTAESADAPLRLQLHGVYNGETVRLAGSVGSIAGVTSGAPLSVDLALTAGGAKANLKGRIGKPAEARDIELAISAAGEDLAALRPLTGASLPAIGPYSLGATVTDRGKLWQVSGLTLKVGESDLGGVATIDLSGTPIAVTAELTSSRLRLADFADRDPPKAGTGRPGEGPAAGGGATDRVFPGAPLPLDGLSAANAVLSLRAQRVEVEKIALDNLSARLTLRNGDLALRPVTADIAGGRLTADMSLRATRRTPGLALKAELAGLDLGQVVAEAGQRQLIDGRLDAAVSLSGAGNSVRAIMAGLNGKIETTMKGGRLDDTLLDLLSSDVLKVLTPGASGKEGVRINCLVGRYDVTKGILSSRATVFDTNRLLVAGEGGIDLGAERIDFLLVPKAKEASLARLVVPLRVGGTLAVPSIYPDPAGIAKGALGVAAGVATGGISLVIGSVLSEVGGGGTEDACAAALAAGTAAPPERKKPPAQTPGDDVKRTIEGIGEGLKGLLGR